MTNVGAEIASWKIVNRAEDLLAALPVGTSSDARQAIESALQSMRRAAEVFADAIEVSASE